MTNQMTIYIDGGSRGNPGEAAFACVFPGKEYAQVIGRATNNEAEYQGLIFALKKAKALLGKDKIRQTALEIRSDSELLVKQMKGEYKIKEPKIQQLFLEAWNLKIDYSQVVFTHVRREENKRADALLNQALDSATNKQSLF